MRKHYRIIVYLQFRDGCVCGEMLTKERPIDGIWFRVPGSKRISYLKNINITCEATTIFSPGPDEPPTLIAINKESCNLKESRIYPLIEDLIKHFGFEMDADIISML